MKSKLFSNLKKDSLIVITTENGYPFVALNVKAGSKDITVKFVKALKKSCGFISFINPHKFVVQDNHSFNLKIKETSDCGLPFEESTVGINIIDCLN